jgi:hypothetical protein
MANKLRESVIKWISRNPGAAIDALKKNGVSLTPDEENEIRNGNLSRWSDNELSQRFNQKVMGFKIEGASAPEGQQGRQSNPMSQQGSQGPRQDANRGNKDASRGNTGYSGRK